MQIIMSKLNVAPKFEPNKEPRNCFNVMEIYQLIIVTSVFPFLYGEFDYRVVHNTLRVIINAVMEKTPYSLCKWTVLSAKIKNLLTSKMCYTFSHNVREIGLEKKCREHFCRLRN